MRIEDRHGTAPALLQAIVHHEVKNPLIGKCPWNHLECRMEIASPVEPSELMGAHQIALIWTPPFTIYKEPLRGWEGEIQTR